MNNQHTHQHSTLSASDALRKKEHLAQRERNVSDEIIRLQSRLESVTTQLNQAKAEAEHVFGTSDIGVLRDKYREMLARNEASLAQYESNISDAEMILAQINNDLNSASSSNA
jgi:archaellum component FlaC